MAVITQLQPITVVFTISEDSLQQVLAQLHKNKRSTVQALDRAQLKMIANGKLLTTDNLIDTTTGTVKLRAVFENKDNTLFPNQFVNTRLLVDTLHDVTLVDSIRNSAQWHAGLRVGDPERHGADPQRNHRDYRQRPDPVTGLNPDEVVAEQQL